MNVCCISRTNYWQGVKGGMDLHARLLGEGMIRNGHSVSMISTYRPGIPEVMEKNGVIYYHLHNTVYGARRHGWAEKSIHQYLALHHKKPFDLLWSQSFDAFGITSINPKIKYPPVMLRLPGSVAQEFRTFISHLSRHLRQPKALMLGALGLFYSYFVTQRPLLKYADGIIAVSQVVVDDIARWFGESFASKCVVVNNGVDIDNFRPDTVLRRKTRQKYGIKDNETMLLSLGRITHEKGHHIAVEALETLLHRGVKVKLMIAGEGPFLDELKREVGKRGLSGSVIFTGYIDNTSTVKYYNAADIYLMPTLTLEGLPFVLLEAMACAKPVIASRLGGNLTLIRDKVNGLFMDPGNVKDLIEKIETILKNKELFLSVAFEARESVINDYSVERMINRYLEVMDSVARHRRINETAAGGL